MAKLYLWELGFSYVWPRDDGASYGHGLLGDALAYATINTMLAARIQIVLKVAHSLVFLAKDIAKVDVAHKLLNHIMLMRNL